MILSELFKSTAVPWNWTFRGSEEVEAKFKIGEIEYVFYAYMGSGDSIGEWEMEFKVGNTTNRRSKYGVTGSGNAAVVMSTIVAIIKDFLNDYIKQVKVIHFTASEKSRRDLYAAMIRRLLPTWTVTHHGTHFTLTSPDAQQTPLPVTKV